jgi:hypothetical protein
MIVPQWSEELVKEAILWLSTTMTREKSPDHLMEPSSISPEYMHHGKPADNGNVWIQRTLSWMWKQGQMQKSISVG